MARSIIAEWEEPSFFPYVTLDSVFPGSLFSSPTPGGVVSHYSVERYDDVEKLWLSIGVPTTPRIEFPVEEFENARIRIRGVLKNGTQLPFVTSNSFLITGMIAEFGNPNSVSLLSFI